MPSHLVQVSYTSQAIASLIKNPQNRVEVISRSITNLGGTLTGAWMSYGDQDVVLIAEMPDDTSVAALALAAAGGGAIKSYRVIPLLTMDEGMIALKMASTSGYTPVKS